MPFVFDWRFCIKRRESRSFSSPPRFVLPHFAHLSQHREEPHPYRPRSGNPSSCVFRLVTTSCLPSNSGNHASVPNTQNSPAKMTGPFTRELVHDTEYNLAIPALGGATSRARAAF